MSNEWKFWVFLVDNVYIVTTYGMIEEDAVANLELLIRGPENQRVDGNRTLTGSIRSLLFTVPSPFDLDEAHTSTLLCLCTLVTQTIIMNDNFNSMIKNVVFNEIEATRH